MIRAALVAVQTLASRLVAFCWWTNRRLPPFFASPAAGAAAAGLAASAGFWAGACWAAGAAGAVVAAGAAGLAASAGLDSAGLAGVVAGGWLQATASGATASVAEPSMSSRSMPRRLIVWATCWVCMVIPPTDRGAQQQGAGTSPVA